MRKCITLFFLSIVLIVSCTEYGGVNPVNVLESVDLPDSGIPAMSSDGGEKNGEISIVHSWIDDTGDITLTFSEGGVYTYIYDDGDSQYNEYGTYSVSDNFLNAMDPDGYSYTETFAVNGNMLTLIDEDGYSQSFTRI